MVEFYEDKQQNLPPLDLLVCKGREDVSIRVSLLFLLHIDITMMLPFQLADQGGGVPRMDMEKIFNYLYSTAIPPTDNTSGENAPLVEYCTNLSN